jgi:hypothetical protein
MIEITLRFAGRFLFYSPDDGTVTALAIDPTAKHDIPRAQPHHLFMTVPQKALVPQERNKLVDNARRATYRLLASTDSASADHSVWNLAHTNITLNAPADGFRWANVDGSVIADLNQLSGNKPFDKKLITDPSDALVVATIRLDTGVGTPRQIRAKKLPYIFVPMDGSQVRATPTIQLADIVDVTVRVASTLVVAVQPRRGKTGITDSIEITADSSSPTVVSFSQLCTQSHEGPDGEFAAFYGAVIDPPPVGQRLVPKVDTEFVHEIPFGDCFPGGIVRF